MTWNTHHGAVGSDGVQRPARIAETIKSLNADIACLQEVEHNTGYGHYDAIALWTGILGDPWKGVFCTRGGQLGVNSGQGNMILSRLPMESVQAKGLVEYRAVLSAKINGIRVCCCHLDNLSASMRSVELQQILCWEPVRNVSPAILAGDWNAQVTTVELAPVAHWYSDAWAIASKAGTATAWNTSGNTRNTRIDIVFYRGLNLKSCAVPDTRDAQGVTPSDHSPVVVEFA